MHTMCIYRERDTYIYVHKAVNLFFISAGVVAMVFVLVQTLLTDLA